MKRFAEQGFVANEEARASRGGRFLRSEDGSLIIFGLFIFLLMLLAGGMGVDFMRFEAQRTRLQSTLDRALLAAASMDQALKPEEVVLDYFEKAGLGYYIDADDIKLYENGNLITSDEDRVDQNALTSRRVEASADMTIGTAFLRFSGIDFLTAPAAGAAEENASLTEVSLVLDTSGSMDDPSASGRKKIAELRDAAEGFINIVLCDPSHPERTAPCVVEQGKVSVSIVPYAEQVLVGDELLSYFNPKDAHNYSSCVDFDAAEYSNTAIAPGALAGTGPQQAGHIDPWPMPYRWVTDEPYEYTPQIATCRTDSWREITAVSGNAALLRNHISALQANGGTSIDIAMKWGVGLLDPAAQPVVSSLVAAGDVDGEYLGRPLEKGVGNSNVEKVVVLMTDGVNFPQYELYDGFYSGPSPVWRTAEKVGNGSNAKYLYSIYDADNNRYKWEHNGDWQDHAYGSGTYEECERVWVRTGRSSGYWDDVCEEVEEDGEGAVQVDFKDLWAAKPWVWWEKWDWLPEPGSSYNTGTKDTRLNTICSAAKNDGVTVFTIGYEVTSASANVLRNCASTTTHYFNANGLNIESAFASIAREITKIRLTN